MTKSLHVPKADLHTPEELLASASALLASGEADVRRAVVLEAITALEAFVHRTIFPVLAKSMDELLVKWLDEKTRMDFDSRLGVLTPVALGHPIDKASDLWTRYQRAKAIRNEVVHKGRKVTHEDAEFVLRTVYDWLEYLGSTAEVALALDGLKRFVERTRLVVRDSVMAVELVRSYFEKTRAATVSTEEATLSGVDQVIRADLVLRFGSQTVLVETKMLPITSEDRDLSALVQHAVAQVSIQIRAHNISRGAVILFVREAPPESFATVRNLDDGHVSVVVIDGSGQGNDPSRPF
jgi:hypothetical protein